MTAARLDPLDEALDAIGALPALRLPSVLIELQRHAVALGLDVAVRKLTEAHRAFEDGLRAMPRANPGSPASPASKED